MLTLLVWGCNNKDYDLNNISTEITVGADGITLPLGKIEKVTLDSLLGSVDKIATDADGNLSIRYDSVMNFKLDAVNIDPVTGIIPDIDPVVVSLSDDNNSFPDYFAMPARSSSFGVEVPSVDLQYNYSPYTSSSLNAFSMLPTGQTTMEGARYLLPINNGSTTYSRYLYLPDAVSSVQTVYFDATANKINILVDLGGMSSFVKKAVIDFKLELLEGAHLELLSNLGGAAVLSGPTSNILTITGYDCGSSLVMSYDVALKKYDCSTLPVQTVEGKRCLETPITVKVLANATITTKAGTVSYSKWIKSSISGVIPLNDADLTLNRQTIDVAPYDYALNYTFSGISPDVQSVKYVKLAAGTKINITGGNAAIPFAGWTTSAVEITLPDYFVLNGSAMPVGSSFNSSTHTVTTTVGQMQAGLSLPVDAFDFGTDGLPVTDEKINLTGNLRMTVKPVLNAGPYRLSAIKAYMGTQNIAINIAGQNLSLDIPGSVVKVNEILSDVAFSEDIDKVIRDIPAELRRIDKVSVKDIAGKDITVRVAIKTDNSPVSKISLKGFQIKLPQCLWAESSHLVAGNIINVPDRVVDIVDGQEILLEEFTLRGLQNLTPENGTITIDDSVVVRGKAGVLSGTELSGSGDVTITPVIQLPDLYATHFSGNVNMNLADYVSPEEIDLSEITSELGDADITLDMVSPIIRLNITNPIGVAVSGALTLTARDAGKAVLSTVTIPGITFNAASGGADGITKLYISESATAPAGYTAVKVDGLSELVHKLPSSFEVAVSGGVDVAASCDLDLGRDYDFGLRYSLELPLAFNGATDIVYTKLFEDLNDDFNDLAEQKIKMESLAVRMKAQSSLPMDLSADFTFLDAAGQPVEGITTKVDGVIRGYYTGVSKGDATTSETSIGISIKNNDMESLRAVNSIRISLHANTDGNKVTFNAAQCLDAVLTIEAQKGITIDVKEL